MPAPLAATVSSIGPIEITGVARIGWTAESAGQSSGLEEQSCDGQNLTNWKFTHRHASVTIFRKQNLHDTGENRELRIATWIS